MARFFVRRPIVAIVIAIVTVLIGAIALFGLPVAQYPQIVPPEIQISSTYTGADAVSVEQSVSTPLEQQINGVDNMLYMKSVNANDGTSTIRVTFAVETDLDTDNVLVQNRVSQATPFLPADVRATGVTVRKSLSSPTVLISFYSPKNTYDATFLANYATINVRDALLRVVGVGDVVGLGAADYAMRIWVKPDQLARLNLTVSDLRDAIGRQNNVNPAGQLGAEPAPKGQDFTYAVRAQGRLITAEEFGDVVVREIPDGSVIRIRDVARIELGAQTYTRIARFNGAPASLIAIYQSPGSNALAMVENVEAAMKELSASFPNDIAYKVSLDTTLSVREGIREIVTTLLEAVLLVVLVVFLFLQNWRATLIPVLTVPVSLIGAFAFFPPLDFSVNTLSLFGLVLAIGLVVDDAIVVVEAVEHHIEAGLSPQEATIKAMSEVSGPVIAIALVLSAVFIPVAFVGGITGRMYQQFALTIAFSVILSAINALTLSPALCSRILKPRGQQKSWLSPFFDRFNRGFDRVRDNYTNVTGRLARKLVIAVGLLAVMAAGAGLLGKKLPSGFVPDEDLGYAFMNVQLPDAASIQRSDAVAKRIEGILAKTEGVESYNTVVGFSLLSGSTASYNAFFFVSFKPWDERKTNAREIVQGLNKQLAQLPEARAFAFLPPSIPGIGTGSGFDLMLQDKSGGTVEDLAKQVDRFVEAARQRPEIGSVNAIFNPRVPQVFVDVDREKALKQGVDLAALYGTLQAFMGGAYINDFNRFGRQWRVYLAAEPEYRIEPENIERFYVRNKDGEMVPLSALVRTRAVSGPEFTNRFNLFRSAEITGAAAPGYSTGQAMNALEQVASQTLAPGYGYAWNALSYQEKVAPSSVPTFMVAILLVFLILAAQYESWSLPFSVLVGTPIAVLGAFLGLFLAKLEFNVYGQIGLVMLIGLSAKNAILIVEFAKLELDRGATPMEAALSAARLRLRPILMTAFAFILGCMPLVVATGAGAVARRILGMVVVCGMLATTVIGVFITPPLFVLVERLTTRRKKPEVAPAASPSPEPAE